MAVDTYLRPFAEVDRAVADGEEDGFVKVHVKAAATRSWAPPSWPGTRAR